MNFKGSYAYVSGWTGSLVLTIANADSPQTVGELPFVAALRGTEDVEPVLGTTLLVGDDGGERSSARFRYVSSLRESEQALRGSAILPLGINWG